MLKCFIMNSAPEYNDHFSEVSANYNLFRPRYPTALFEHLDSICPEKKLAWDCATGNGQAAFSLARYFEMVIATDASEEQISHAEQHPRVSYQVTTAEDSKLPDQSVNLITVAQALHWFDLAAFYDEVRRVLKPGGLLAVWTYDLMKLEIRELEPLIKNFYENVVGPYWPPQRKLVENHYRDIEFPFQEQDTPKFKIESALVLEELAGYIRTWSATQRYQKDHGTDPVIELEKSLSQVWDEAEFPITVEWPITLRVGTI